MLELFDIHTAEEIRNSDGTWKNSDDILGSGGRLEEHDKRIRCSNFRRGQLSLCPFEAEVAGLRYACKKENHFLQSCPSIKIITNCKELISTY